MTEVVSSPLLGRRRWGAVGVSAARFCPSDRFKAAFPEALSWKPEGETQSNSALQQYSTKQYNQAAIISHPKGESNIFPSFFSSFSLPILH